MNRRQRIPRPPPDAQQTTRHGGTVEKQTSPRTLKTYKSALKTYREWCTSNNIRPEPSDFIQVNDYLTHLYDDGYAPNTIVVASAAIVNEWRQWKKCAPIQRHLKQIVGDTLANGYVPQQAPPFTWNDLVALYQLELRPRKKGRGMESEEVARSHALRFFSQIAIMLTCGGVRIAEAGAIEWHDIIPDEDGWGLLLLPKTKANPRATKRKIIPVVMDIFNQYARDGADGAAHPGSPDRPSLSPSQHPDSKAARTPISTREMGVLPLMSARIRVHTGRSPNLDE